MFSLRGRFALLFILSALFFLVLPFASGSAKDLPSAITDVAIAQSTAGQYSAVTVDIAWSLPSTARPGDTFTVDLPASLVAQNATFPLRAPDGSIVANAVVENGVVTFTATDYVSTHRNVHGTAHLDAHFNQSKITPGTTNDFNFLAGSTHYDGKVAIGTTAAATHTYPTKIGFWTDPSDQGATKPSDALRWVIDSKAGPLTNLSFHDTLGPGQVNDCTTLTVQSSTQFTASGALKNAQPVGARASISCSATGFTVSMPTVKPGEVVEARYATTITDQSAAPFINKVTVSANGHTTPISRTERHYGAYGSGVGDTPTPSTTAPTTVPTTTVPTTTVPTTTVPTTTVPTTTVPTTTVPTTTVPTTTVKATTTARSTTVPNSSVQGATIVRGTASTSPQAVATSNTSLPFTGARISVWTEIGCALLLSGVALLLLGRRRTSKHS